MADPSHPVTPTCNNPLGYTMPESRKRELVRLARRYDVAIIEDDIYGDLAFESPRPKAIKAFDDEGRVLLCSGVSKSLMPGLRVGWIAPGRYRDRALHEKYVSTGASATQPQRAVATFIEKGHYQRHLREINRRYQRQRDIMIDWVGDYFPTGTRISQPQAASCFGWSWPIQSTRRLSTSASPSNACTWRRGQCSPPRASIATVCASITPSGPRCARGRDSPRRRAR